MSPVPKIRELGTPTSERSVVMRKAFGIRTENGWIASPYPITKYRCPILESAEIEIADKGDRVEAECRRGVRFTRAGIPKGGHLVTKRGTVIEYFGDGYRTVIIRWDDGSETFTNPVFGEQGVVVNNLRLAKNLTNRG